MIKRTIEGRIQSSIASRPVTLITGARQVGKTTLATAFMENGFGYVSIDNTGDMLTAQADPELFLQFHPYPLIIDEIQNAPGLFRALEHSVNSAKLANVRNYGMYILTGSQSYSMMNGVTESMAGRVSIIEMSPLSRSEILGRSEIPFSPDDLPALVKRANECPWSASDLFANIVHGSFPELYDNPKLSRSDFYESYVRTYMERDVCSLLKVGYVSAFRRFLEAIASLTGQELVYDALAKAVEVDEKTIASWVSILESGHLITLLRPYNETSVVKRVRKRPKMYFCDTGLACHLAKIDSPETLSVSYFAGRFVETYVVNEVMKSYKNNGVNAGFYYYRDKEQNEIDLLILRDGTLYPIEIKTGTRFDAKAVKSFKKIEGSKYRIGRGSILCNSASVYPVSDNVYAIPISSI